MPDTNEIRNILIQARELISVPERWTQGNYAQTADGKSIGSIEASATCWCSLGAIRRASLGSVMPGSMFGAIYALTAAMNGLVGRFNDTHTHAEVVDRFGRAIASIPESV